jgi:hypothetical protein
MYGKNLEPFIRWIDDRPVTEIEPHDLEMFRASRRAGRAAEVRSPLGAGVRDAVMRALPDRIAIAQQRRIAEFRP